MHQKVELINANLRILIGNPPWMAAQTVAAVIDITTHLAMIGIRTRFIVLVASDAGEHDKVRRIGMALRTCRPFAAVITAVYRKMLTVVVKRRWGPGAGIMARFTGRRKFGSGMHWIRC